MKAIEEVRTMFSRRMAEVQASKTSGARSKANAMIGYGRRIINLAAGELHFELPEEIKQIAVEAVLRGTNRYSETIGTASLRESICTHLSTKTGGCWSSEEIAVTAGAKQALFNLAVALFDDGDEVLVPAPYWTTFPTQIRLAGATPVFLDTATTDYRLDPSNVEKAITSRTKAIIVNTPNNPTGRVVHPEALLRIAELAVRRKFWLVLDQCYSDFTFVEHLHVKLIEAHPAIRERLLIVDSFSKSLALAGWRIGFCAAPAKIISQVSALQSHTTSNPNTIAQHTVDVAIRSGALGRFQARAKMALRNNRTDGLALLASNPHLRICEPDGGFYFYVNVSGLISAQNNEGSSWRGGSIADYLLERAGVAAVSGEAFGDSMSLRLSYSLAHADVMEGLTRVAHALRPENFDVSAL